MDETIGVKGGHNDRLRSLRISKAQKKKLQEYEEDYIKQLEKRVRKQQRYTLIKAIPIVVTGTIIHNLFGIGQEDTRKEDERLRYIEQGDIDEQEEKERVKVELKERKIITLPTGEKVIVHIPRREEKKEEVKEEIPEGIIIHDIPEPKKKQSVEPVQVTAPVLEKPFLFIPKQQEERKEPVINDGFLEEIESDITFKDVDFNNLDELAKEKLAKLRSRRIIEYYEDKLKEIRYDLRKTIYDYNVLVYDEDGIVLSKDAEIILDRLTELISRIEELKKKIDIEHLDKYDDNYIYVLIEEYINDFRDKKIVKEIKDSPLYVLISEKLDELEKRRDSYSKEIEKKQDKLAVKEEDFEDLKKKYYSIDRLNQELYEFQKDQEKIIIDLREKVANSVSTYERVEYELKAMTAGTTRLIRLMMFQMFLPGPKQAKAFAASTAAYLYFLKNIYNPNLVEKKYQVIQVADYSSEIERSISSIDDASKLLGKTSSQIDKMLKEISEKYKDYIGVISECDSIIASLKRIKQDVEEKEYEMKRLRKEQELILEKNNAKVLTRGEYPVN